MKAHNDNNNHPGSQNEMLSWLLLQVIQLVKHRLHGVAEEYDLSVMQLSAFMVLTPDTMVPMSSLSHQLACDASSITGIVDRLEARGLAERRDNPADRRLKLVALTQTGAALQQKITIEVTALEEARLRPILSPSEQQELKRLLKKILAQ
jgi:DNA-binding MarR family transcriptional regulator